MRYQGKISEWNAVRGFGFIERNGDREKAFLHISALIDRRRKPSVGDVVTYTLSRDARGRPRASEVAIPSHDRVIRRAPERRVRIRWGRFALPFLVAGSVLAYQQLNPIEESHEESPDFIAEPPSPDQSDSETRTNDFQCEGKTHCSQMSSCEEARFYLQNCPNTEMDGNHDGVPCQSQWCG